MWVHLCRCCFLWITSGSVRTRILPLDPCAPLPPSVRAPNLGPCTLLPKSCGCRDGSHTSRSWGKFSAALYMCPAARHRCARHAASAAMPACKLAAPRAHAWQLATTAQNFLMCRGGDARRSCCVSIHYECASLHATGGWSRRLFVLYLMQ